MKDLTWARNSPVGEVVDKLTMEEMDETMDDTMEEDVEMMEASTSKDSEGDPVIIVTKVEEADKRSMTGSLKSEEDTMSEDEFSFASLESKEEDNGGAADYVHLSEPFDMDLLRSCIEGGSEVLEKVQGQDVVLVVGKTGVGKSLFIQGIAGKEIVAVDHQTSYSGDTVSNTVFEAKDPLPGFEVGHKKASKTRYIKHFVRQCGGKNVKALVYVDTAGFEDTGGPEVDIATSVMLGQVAKKARSLRFVVLVNYASLLEDRGGAMRFISKLAHTFVSEFDKDKKSFMFLFTHANEAQPSGSLDESRRSLAGEILRIMEGTSDSDVKDVLKFMHRSLSKRYPFVDILDPLQSDFKGIANFVEKKLPTIQHPALVMNCGLTTQSKMKLTGQLQKMLYTLRTLLAKESSTPEDVQKLQVLRGNFRYFNSYIEVVDVKKAFVECEDIFTKHLHAQRLALEEGLRSATDEKDRFDSRNAAMMFASFAQLKEFLPDSDAEYIAKRIKEAVDASHVRMASLLDLENVEVLVFELGKVKSWSEHFVDFTPVYNEARFSVETKIEEALAAAAMQMSRSLEDLTEEEIVCHIKLLVSLERSVQIKAKLAFHEINVDTCYTALEKMKCEVQSFARRLEASSGAKSDDWNDTQQILRLIASGVRKLEYIFVVLREKQAIPDSLEIISRTLAKLEFFVSGCLETTFAEMCSNLEDLREDLEEKMDSLSNIVATLETVAGPRWMSVRQTYRNALESMKSMLKTKYGELVGSARLCAEAGMRDGTEEAKRFLSFQMYSWFDKFLDNDGFVQAHCDSLYIVYCSKIKKLMVDIKTTCIKLSVGSEMNTQTLKECHQAFSEMKQFEKFEKEVGKSSLVEAGKKEALSGLANYRKDLTEKTKEQCDKWYTSLKNKEFDEARILTEALDSVLLEMETIESFSSLKGLVSDAIKSKGYILDTFQKANRYAEDLFSKTADYQAKADCLACIAKINGYSRTDKYLPAYSNFEEKARKLVADDAISLERFVESSVDETQICDRLKKYECAKVLDAYTSDEASNRLRTLHALRDKRMDETDKYVADAVQRLDFKGLDLFLKPIEHSRNPIKKRKYEQYKRAIAKELKERAALAHTKLSLLLSESEVKEVAIILSLLKDARSEIGSHLTGSTFNCSSELNRLQRELNERLRMLTSAVVKGIQLNDFYMMGTNRHLARTIYENAEPFLFFKDKKEFTKADAEFEEAVKKAPRQVDSFLSSHFKDSKRLEEMLSSLQSASDTRSSVLPELKELYLAMKTDLSQRTNSHLREIHAQVTECDSYVDGIQVLETFDEAWPKLMSHAGPLPFDPQIVLDEWKDKQAKIDLDFSGDNMADNLHKCKARLDRLKEKTWANWLFSSHATYDKLQRELDSLAQRKYTSGFSSVRERNWVSLQTSLNVLELMAKALPEHVPTANIKKNKLCEATVKEFIELCGHSATWLENANCLDPSSFISFETVLPHLRECSLRFSFVLKDAEGKKEFCLVSQLVHDALLDGITKLEAAIANHSFAEVRALVMHNRLHGAFLADHFVLLREELQQIQLLKDDQWLNEIWKLCCNYFFAGRDLANIKYCAVLGVVPSAPVEGIRKAYKQKALGVHPDKKDSVHGDIGEEFRRVKEAHDILVESRSKGDFDTQQLFSSMIQEIPGTLAKAAKKYLHDQKYDKVEQLLERIANLQLISDLVSPASDHDKTRESIIDIVRRDISGLRVKMDTCWSERRYKELNHCISDLKEMEKHLKSFPEVFSESWNQGMTKKVEDEIDSLGLKARSLLKDRKTANDCADDFRRCFIQMGYVLVELQAFKDYTRIVMQDVLESCLNSDWGFSYLFKLGLNFHKGDASIGEDENRVAQTLLSEFSHFKEVMTMVWNEETAQKPVEDTVRDIYGKMRTSRGAAASASDIDKDSLLQSFQAFESEYKYLLGHYMAADADREQLAKKTIALANNLKPLSSACGWDSTVKDKVPLILAGVFALFTILKSGETFNRIQATADQQGIGEKLLMKPHNIQVLTLLHLLGCGKPSGTSLENHLMQIRTGEGKSIILGGAATMLGLLGFKVRCVCYSEYLSKRDYSLFKDIFTYFGLNGLITYSKITTLSEDTTARKGDIRDLTNSLLRQRLNRCATNPQVVKNNTLDSDGRNPAIGLTPSSGMNQNQNASSSSGEFANLAVPSQAIGLGGAATDAPQETMERLAVPTPDCKSLGVTEEILLVDEVDVFFGPDFYGQTYNKVMELHEPEIAELLSSIWATHNMQSSRKQRLSDIQATDIYARLVSKMPSLQFLIDNEIRLMLDHVHRVDEEPYYVDAERGRIGYRVMDTICYQVTYGYRTVFAYLKEAHAGNLRNSDATLKKVLNMPISCGQFSYANISPSRILGVSGTLEAMGEYEKDILLTYGINKFIFVPSVYGKSNFVFDKAGEGIFIEPDKSDYFQKITEEIQSKTQQTRAVIVFFEDRTRLEEFRSSPFFPKLGRQKAILSENMDPSDKEFVINKAATSGQVTLSTAVFGRGTDFFCQDDRVQDGGGVHIIQTFLSMERSEEVQIQGRTSRQGKKGSYQLVLWEDDLFNAFDIARGAKDNVPRNQRYEWLSKAREKRHSQHWKAVECNLVLATKRDVATHKYFDALLAGKQDRAEKLFKELYLTIAKPPVPESISVDVALLLDITGSMSPFCQSTVSTIQGLVTGVNSIVTKLKSQFPDTAVKLRLGVLGYRDIDDGTSQFCESSWNGSHFTDSATDALAYVQRVTSNPSGGHDLAEDHLGAISRCVSWNSPSDWTSPIKLALLFTDAPAHGHAPPACASIPNVDAYAVRHPHGLTPASVGSALLSKGINLIFCSYNPSVTALTERKLSQEYFCHPSNSEEKEIKSISMVPKTSVQKGSGQAMIGDHPRHIVFVLDESGSMSGDWNGVVDAYNKYIAQRRQNQNELDLVSVIQFDNTARVTVDCQPIATASTSLDYRGGGTQFAPAALEGSRVAVLTPLSHKPTVVFMSDGGANDASRAASTFSALNQQVQQKHSCDLDLNVIAFGGGADTQQLQQISQASPKGRVYLSSDTVQLSNIFVSIAGGQQVATVLQEEISKEISEAVSDTLSLGYLS